MKGHLLRFICAIQKCEMACLQSLYMPKTGVNVQKPFVERAKTDLLCILIHNGMKLKVDIMLTKRNLLFVAAIRASAYFLQQKR